jgi:hypothetical protein
LHDPISLRVWKTINADLDGFEAEIKGAEGGWLTRSIHKFVVSWAREAYDAQV